MTREEATYLLNNLRSVAEGQEDEAIDMAIEALTSKNLTEPNNTCEVDLISRADAIKCVDYWIDDDATDDAQARAVAIKNDLRYMPSAEAVQGWIPFTRRPMTEEEQKNYPNCTFIFDCVLPDDGDEILVSNGRFVWMDTFCNDIDGCYLDSGDDIDEDMAWMPLPTPYKGGDSECV